MPPLEESDRFQKAVLWERGKTGSDGRARVKEPVEIEVDWVENISGIRQANNENETTTVQARVDRKIKVGSLLWLGELAELPVGTSFSEEDGEIFVVTGYSSVADIKGREEERTVSLMRYRSTLPEITLRD